MVLRDLLTKHQEGKLSFNDSVALFFEIYPDKKNALQSFLQHEDQFSWKKVNQGLDEKIQELDDLPAQNNFKEFAKSKHIENPINVEILPDELRQEYADRIPKIREIAHLHARLKFAEPKDLTEIAARIVELTEQRRATFTKVDRFIATGKILEKDEEVSPEKIDPSKLKNFEREYELKLLRSRRSKLKNRPARIEEYNAVNKQIKELEAKRYV